MSNSREGLHNSFPRVTLGIFSIIWRYLFNPSKGRAVQWVWYMLCARRYTLHVWGEDGITSESKLAKASTKFVAATSEAQHLRSASHTQGLDLLIKPHPYKRESKIENSESMANSVGFSILNSGFSILDSEFSIFDSCL